MRSAKKKSRPPVRVRHDPPTLEEAVFAARGLTDDAEHQAEIAAQLMGVELDEAREAVRLAEIAAAQEARRTIVTPAARYGEAAPRGVIVERRPSRNFMTVPRPTVVRLTPR
jgi:hypothetical protein